MSDPNRSLAADTTRQKMVIERTYPARVEELWELWTTKDGFESWWGPVDFCVEVHAIDPRVGGVLHYSMIAATPGMVALMQQMGRPASHESRARFAEVRLHEKLALTHMIDFLPGMPPYENTMVVEFFPSGGNVRMVVTLDPMHDTEFTQMSIMGFTSQLTKLDGRFGK